MSMPASAWRSTTYFTLSATNASNAARSTGLPATRSITISSSAAGRHRLPTCVVRMRSPKPFMLLLHYLFEKCRCRYPAQKAPQHRQFASAALRGEGARDLECPAQGDPEFTRRRDTRVRVDRARIHLEVVPL